jgi:hypothetical protein
MRPADLGFRVLVSDPAIKVWHHGWPRSIVPRPSILAMCSVEGLPPFPHPADFYRSFVFDEGPDSVNGYLYTLRGATLLSAVPDPVPIALSAAEWLADDASRVVTVKQRIVDAIGLEPFVVADKWSLRDDVVANREIILVVIDPATMDGGATRSGDVQIDGLTLASEVSFLGSRVGLMTACHEILHQWGAVDVYGADDLNLGLSLMGSTASGVLDDRNFAMLDPWHRMALGVTRPTLIDIHEEPWGDVDLLAATFGVFAPAILFYDSHRGVQDFFLVELRLQTPRNGMKTFDRGVPEGFVVWQVSVGSDLMPYIVPSLTVAGGEDYSINALGSDGLTRGSHQTWGNQTVPELPYLDGSPSRLQMNFHRLAGEPFGRVTWFRP